MIVEDCPRLYTMKMAQKKSRKPVKTCYLALHTPTRSDKIEVGKQNIERVPRLTASRKPLEITAWE